tara:strand:+ start:279 stop:488 length:210 start_codon:yes stop_codon:yes gene_type:complete
MTNKYKIKDVLDAVDVLLNNKKESPLKLVNEFEKPLQLKNEFNNSKNQTGKIPKDTEKIILQAEKYLKK